MSGVRYDWRGGWSANDSGDGGYGRRSVYCASDDGRRRIQRSWNGAPQQRWRLEQVGGDYYRIVSVGNGKCLDVTEQGGQDGANVQLWAYANQANQQRRLRR